MLKLIIVGRRRPGATRAHAQHHLMHVHGALVIDPPGDAGAMPAHYVQNHVFDGAYPAGADAAHALERDLVTELWFESPQALGASTATPYYLQHLQPDEDNFVDRSSVAAGLHEATSRGDAAAGPFKLFAFLTAAEAADASGLSAAVRHAWRDVVGRDGVQDLVFNTPLRRPGAAPFADVVVEAWFAQAQAARAFAHARLPELAAALGAGRVDPSASLHLLAEEFTTERLRAAHRAA